MYRGKRAYVSLCVSAGTQMLFLDGPSSFNVIPVRKNSDGTPCLVIFPDTYLHLSSDEEKEISLQYFLQQNSCISPAVKC